MGLRHSTTLIFMLFLAGTFITELNINQLQAEEKARTEFRDIKPGPFNPPLHFDVIEDLKRKPIPIIPPQDSSPFIRTLKEGNLIKGEHNYKGKILRADSPNVIRFIPEKGHEIMIGLALPKNFPLKKPDAVEGSLYVNDHSSLEGADQIVTLLVEQGLFVGNIWKISEKPITYAPAGSVSLTQIPLKELPAGDVMQTVQVSVATDKTAQIVPCGESFNFTVGGKKYTVFVQTSIFQGVTDKGDDTRTGYILRAMVAEN